MCTLVHRHPTMDRVYAYRKTIESVKRPSWPNTTTITVTSSYPKTQGATIDKTRIERLFEKIKVLPVYYGNIKTPFEWKQFYSDFYNQTSIGYTDCLSTKKVKIFPNGSLQIAGCSDMQDCDRFISQLRLIMKLVYNIDIPRESFTVAMYNSSFSLNHFIDVYKLIDLLDLNGYTYQYDPDRYSAVKIKIPRGERKVTVSVFVSGSILITGGTCEEDIAEIYISISKLCQEVLMDENRIKENVEVYMGYPIDKYFK